MTRPDPYNINNWHMEIITYESYDDVIPALYNIEIYEKQLYLNLSSENHWDEWVSPFSDGAIYPQIPKKLKAKLLISDLEIDQKDLILSLSTIEENRNVK